MKSPSGRDAEDLHQHFHRPQHQAGAGDKKALLELWHGPSSLVYIPVNTWTVEWLRKLMENRAFGLVCLRTTEQYGGRSTPLADHVGKADTMKGVADEVQTGDFADDGFETSDAGKVSDSVLGQ